MFTLDDKQKIGLPSHTV